MKLRAVLLTIAAIAGVAAVLAVQLSSGGSRFLPTRVTAADACVPRPLPPPTADLEAVIEEVVLGGVQRAACTLGVSRERLLISLPSAEDRETLARGRGRSGKDLVDAVQAGMIAEIRSLDGGRRLPPTSRLLKDNAAELGLSGLAAAAIRQVPSSTIDQLLPIAGVLERSIGNLDLNALVGRIDDPDQLETALRKAVSDAAVSEAQDQLLKLAPTSLGDLFGG